MITPKEKAKELIDKYDKLLPCEGTTTGQTPIECALIAVNEIINELIKYTRWSNTNPLCFWQLVKKEIELL